jgi:hypothetical protein
MAGLSVHGQDHQPDINAAYSLIMETQLGQAICRQILGGDAEAIEFHLGVSPAAAQLIAQRCPRSARHAWIYATRPNDIRKLTISGSSARKYKVFVSDLAFPIESWTEPFTNTTVIIAPSLPIKRERLVKILAHEMAVYFDSKANPAHPDAGHIPSLRQLNIQSTGTLDPLVTLSNPLHSHALTFVRALQVETEVLKDLARAGKIEFKNQIEPAYAELVSGQCGHACLKALVLKIREALLPIGLPLLAFAPHYRSLILQELPNLRLNWTEEAWQRAQQALNHLPVDFLRTQSGGDPVSDMYRVFFADTNQQSRYHVVTKFLDKDLWPLEEEALFSAHVNGGSTLLEFMKLPTLSGYNVGLSSGPRVRIRTGNVE